MSGRFFRLMHWDFRLAHVTLVGDLSNREEYSGNPDFKSLGMRWGFDLQMYHPETILRAHYETEAEAVAVRQKLMEALNESTD